MLRPYKGPTLSATQDMISDVDRSPNGQRIIQVEIPEEAFQHRSWEPGKIAREMRSLWLLEEVRARRLGYGKAAELAAMPVADFLRLMGTHQITPFDYDQNELIREISR